VRAHAAAKEAGVHLIIGAFVEPIDAAPLVLWVKKQEGVRKSMQVVDHRVFETRLFT
jgi:hypothetical protein